MHNWVFVPSFCSGTQTEIVFTVLTTVSSKQITLRGRTKFERGPSWTSIICQLLAWSYLKISCDRSLISWARRCPLRKNCLKGFHSGTLRNVSKAMVSSTSKSGQLLTYLLLWFGESARTILIPTSRKNTPSVLSLGNKTENSTGHTAFWWWKFQRSW